MLSETSDKFYRPSGCFIPDNSTLKKDLRVSFCCTDLYQELHNMTSHFSQFLCMYVSEQYKFIHNIIKRICKTVTWYNGKIYSVYK
jgi:hypothetical protein